MKYSFSQENKKLLQVWSEIISQHRDLWVDNLKSMACKQNLPCPALLHQPFAILGSVPFGNGLKIAVTLLRTGGRWGSARSVAALQAALLRVARNYRAAIFTFASGSSCRCTWCWVGQTSICTKKASISLPKSAHSASSPYTWVQYFSHPKPIVYSSLDCKLWKPQSAFLAAAQH